MQLPVVTVSDRYGTTSRVQMEGMTLGEAITETLRAHCSSEHIAMTNILDAANSLEESSRRQLIDLLRNYGPD